MPSGQAMADWRAECLNAGRYALLVAEYAFPLAVYLPGQPPLRATPRLVREFFQSFHVALASGGFDRLTARVTAEALPFGGRRRLWTDWIGAGRSRAPALVAQTVCYSRSTGGRCRTEMLEFTRLDLPVLAAA